MADTPARPPARVAHLPRDKHGRFVPWFVAWIDGVPDFRIVAAGKVTEAVRFSKCFVCGQDLGRFVTFAVGPMSTINRSAPEPPTHKDCALYAAQSCPFLLRPGKGRRSGGLPAGLALETHGPGVTTPHNPGVTALWTTRSYEPQPDGKGGLLFRMGDPEEVLWLAEGRPATRAEAGEALANERDTLEELIRAGPTSAQPADLAALASGYAAAERLLPA